MKLLVRWLPADHPQRAEADELRRKLLERLQALERLATPPPGQPEGQDDDW